MREEIANYYFTGSSFEIKMILAAWRPALISSIGWNYPPFSDIT